MNDLDGDNLVLGIDAGNTKTIALIADTSGTVRGYGRAGPSNIYVIPEQALRNLEDAVEAARTNAGLGQWLGQGSPQSTPVLPLTGTNAGLGQWLGQGPLRAVTLSATGADWPEDFTMLEGELRRWNWAASQQVVNDAVGALRAGSLDGLGVAVACGTSAGIAARSEGGKVWHSSYWQEPEGAEDLAQAALRAVYRAELGIEPPTELTGKVLAHFKMPSVEALLHSFTGRDQTPQAQLGRLARVLLDAAAAGDPTSLGLVKKHGSALGDYALAAARKVGLSGNYLLTTSGGVMRHPSPILREALMERVQEAHPEVRWQASHHEPVFGALLLALELAGCLIDDALFGRLEETCPNESLFLT